MKDFFKSNEWNIFIVIVLGIVAFFTKELVTYAMLGFVLIILSNIYDKLDEISQKLGK